MSYSLIWICGASSGIGRALVDTIPWSNSRVINISRRSTPGAEHLPADLADPASWARVGDSFRSELAAYNGERVVFIHAAGTLEPTGFAGEVDTDSYVASVLLNSAAPQVLGHQYLTAVRNLLAERHLIMLSSGAARSVYAGWTTYGAGKAAVDQWVRNAGAEQKIRGGVHVLAVAPGTVRTDMQSQLRETPAEQFPQRQKFVELHEQDKLTDPLDAARQIWGLLELGLETGSVVDLRDLPRDKPVVVTS